MASGEGSCSGAYVSNNIVAYDYGTSDDKKSESNKAPSFNGNPEEFSWWKTKMYSYIMGLDEELWDVLEDGVSDLSLDEEWAAADRKKHTLAQKKLYKKHHKIRKILVAALPRTEYLKMSDKSTAKAIFSSLCANYEGSMKVKEAKATILVHKYELFKMKDDETIEAICNTLFSRLKNFFKQIIRVNK